MDYLENFFKGFICIHILVMMDLRHTDEPGHPADGSQRRKIDRMYLEFDLYARNIRFGLSTDGMNPFGEMSSGHSTWPVTLCMYNLPPWLA